MKKIIFTVLLIFVSLTVTVYAISTSGDVQGGSIDNNGVGRGATKHPSPYFDGIRVSIVKSDGTDVASRTYIQDDQYKNNSNVQLRATNICSRPAYANKKCTLNFKKDKQTIGSLAEPLSNLQKLLGSAKASDGSVYNFSLNLETKVVSNSYTGMFDGFYKENTSLSQEDYDKYMEAWLNTLLKEYNAGKLEDYLVAGETNALYDLFIVVEPVEVVLMNGELFMGTSYELAYEARYNQKGGGFVTSSGVAPCRYSSTGALCDLNAVLRRSSPCKTYLDGNIIDSMKQKGSTILIKNFPDGYYFKNIKIDYKNSKKICDTSGKDVYLSNDVSTGNYGVGMGVLWVSDVYSGKENACDTVKEKIGWNNLEKKFETEYAKNGVQGLYKLYSNGYINYTDGSDKVDVKWFVNQCTCYGIYEHYASSALNSYKTQNQVAIIDLVGVFGDFDWFVAPQLYVTKGSLIGSKFDSGTFTSYNNTWQTYSNEHKLEWTPITEDYYLNSLNCGTTENYWCEEFEKWYGDMKTKYSLTSYPTIATIKKASMSTFNSRYREKLQTMIDAYNLSFYPASGFKWTLENDDSGTNYSYIKNCINANVASCDSIKNFYGSSLTNLSCDRIEKFDFSVYNNQKGTNITGQWYISNCGCDKATSYNCTPNYDLGTCTTGDDIIYSDSSNGIVEDEYWENCVFNDNGTYDIVDHKWADQSESLTYYEDELTNKYCEVYCIEDLNASLAAPNVYVEAGSRFTWGYSSVKGSRTCKTKSVEWSRFKKDLENANDDAVDAYVDYQLEILIKESIENYTVTTSSSSCSCKNNIYYNDKTTVTCCDELAIDSVTNMVKLDSNGKPICKKRNYERYDLYTAEPVEFSVTSKYGDEKHEKWNGKKWCSGGRTNTTKPTYDSNKANGVYYRSALSKVQGIINTMKECYTWNESDVYEVDPKATIIYSDDINYYYKDELNKSTSYSFTNQSVCTTEDVEQIKGCSGNSCSPTDVTMKNCSGDDRYVMMTRNATTRFTLKSNVFRYILKSNHLSIHPNDLANNSVEHFTTNYIDVGFSNFPVSYSASEGVYGSNEDKGQFDIEYSNLGHVETGKTMVDTILSGSDIPQSKDEEYGKWICQYTVYSDLLPEDDGNKDDGNKDDGIGDINLIYRPIDLYNAFPDIDASGRKTGANWCDEEGNCSDDNLTVEAYIHNNRGVEYDELYELEPMYTFVLNPTIIKEIREYNDENSYTSYTGKIGTNKYFDFKCAKGTGNGCISEYLTYLIDITDAKNKPGTCVADKFRNVNDTTSFYDCRY